MKYVQHSASDMDGPLAWRVVPEDASVQRAYASLQDIVHAEDKEKGAVPIRSTRVSAA